MNLSSEYQQEVDEQVAAIYELHKDEVYYRSMYEQTRDACDGAVFELRKLVAKQMGLPRKAPVLTGIVQKLINERRRLEEQ